MSQTASPKLVPPFTEETAAMKVKAAEALWNTCDAERVALAYTEDSDWRNRDEFLKGRAAIIDFLKRKWQKELDYSLRKTLWTFNENRISVSFEYESRDASGQWYRSYGVELWEFALDGRMRRRIASINDTKIAESERRLQRD
jgi:nuclear transport factor 2 (NTF2) superfamily protein